MSVSATDEEVEVAVDRVKQQYNLATDAEFDAALAQSGMTRDELKRQMRETITLQKVIGRDVTSQAWTCPTTRCASSTSGARSSSTRSRSRRTSPRSCCKFSPDDAEARQQAVAADRGDPREDQGRGDLRRPREGVLRGQHQRDGAAISASSPRASSSRRSTPRSSSTPAAGVPGAGAAARLDPPLPRDRPQGRRLQAVRRGQGRPEASGSPTTSTRSASPSTWTSCAATPSSRSTSRSSRSSTRRRPASPAARACASRLAPASRLLLRRGRAFARLVRPAAVLLRRRARHADDASRRDRRRWTFRARNGGLEISGPGGDARSARAIARARSSRSTSSSRDSGAALAERGRRCARALARGGGRMLRAPTLFEDAVKMLFTTNCSWAATRGMVVRLIALAGGGRRVSGPRRRSRGSRRRALESEVRCGYRAGALSRFARRVASGRLDLVAVGAPRDAGGRGARGDPRRARLRPLRRGGPPAHPRPARVPRARFVDPEAVPALYPGPAKTADGAIARRYARFGDFKGLALWLDLTRDWHEGEARAVWPVSGARLHNCAWAPSALRLFSAPNFFRQTSFLD